MIFNQKLYPYIITVIVLIGVAKHFYDKQELRILKKQFNQERDIWIEERDQLIEHRYMAIDSAVAAQKPIYIKIKDLQRKDEDLKQQQQRLKLKRDEIQSYIDRASESVLDSVLRSN